MLEPPVYQTSSSGYTSQEATQPAMVERPPSDDTPTNLPATHSKRGYDPEVSQSEKAKQHHEDGIPVKGDACAARRSCSSLVLASVAAALASMLLPF